MWRDLVANGKHRHVCPMDRPTCNAVMRHPMERCARRPGHTTEHRTRYALDNALRMKTGRDRSDSAYNDKQERGGRRRPQPSAPPRSCY